MSETGSELDCPIESCGGEISWAAVEGRNFVVFNAGTCYVCGTLAGECPNHTCGEITGELGGSEVKCDGCLGRYSAHVAPGDDPSPADLTWWIPETA